MAHTLSEIVKQEDALLSRERFGEAGELLSLAARSFTEEGDLFSALSVYNELMGFERQYGTSERALAAAEKALSLVETLELTNAAPAGMFYLNAGTVHASAGDFPEAIRLYERAEEVFRRHYEAADPIWAGLYNNKAACYLNEKEWRRAEYYYLRAVRLLDRSREPCDLAVSYLNLAEMYARFAPLSAESDENARRALAALAEAPERDAYYYYTCRKAERSLSVLGYFADAAALRERADRYYERA